jgi:hypothetical protein
MNIKGAMFGITILGLGFMTPLDMSQANAATQGFGFGLDCNAENGFAYNGDSSPSFVCADFLDLDLDNGGFARGYDNGHYIGHDEPILAFFSDKPGSANNTQWEFVLPRENPPPATQSFQNFIAFWLSMTLCDPASMPFGDCNPNSDVNALNAGAAFLELQFYPPGKPFFFGSGQCPDGQWCAAMTIDELTGNAKCDEPIEFALIQRDGVPTGPVTPSLLTIGSATPNAQTLIMGGGDRIRVTLHDTADGLIAEVKDLTTGASGFMVASAANGFAQVAPSTCTPSPFSYHPLWDTATQEHITPWLDGRANIAFAMEIGHFETPNGDTDDSSCISGIGCLGADSDFDGGSYLRDWPDGTSNHATSIKIGSVKGGGIGPLSLSDEGEYDNPYPTIRFETTTNNVAGVVCPGSGCKLPPDAAEFYPFYAMIIEDHDGKPRGDVEDHKKHDVKDHKKPGEDEACFMVFGNFTGTLVNNFDADAQYGASDTARFSSLFTSPPEPNPCLPEIKEKNKKIAKD